MAAVLSNTATVVSVVAFIAAFWAVIELAQRFVIGERDAARDALRGEHERYLIDEEALARGLRSIDEAV